MPPTAAAPACRITTAPKVKPRAHGWAGDWRRWDHRFPAMPPILWSPSYGGCRTASQVAAIPPMARSGPATSTQPTKRRAPPHGAAPRKPTQSPAPHRDFAAATHHARHRPLPRILQESSKSAAASCLRERPHCSPGSLLQPKERQHEKVHWRRGGRHRRDLGAGPSTKVGHAISGCSACPYSFGRVAPDPGGGCTPRGRPNQPESGAKFYVR